MIIPWDLFDCLFVGGTTEWKLSQSALDVAREAKQHGKMLHLGRVNSDCRMTFAFNAGFDSIDGMSYARFGRKYLHDALDYLDGLHRQLKLF